MKHAILLLAFLISGAMPQLAQTPRPEIKILMEIRPEVNYVTHLYTLAGLGFADSSYAAKYGYTLPQEAIDTLQKYKDYLTFGQGEGGMLAGPFFFGVSAENIPNVDSMQVVMNVVMNEGRKANAPADVMAAVRAVADVYATHYDAYLKNIYPQVKADMEERRQLLSQKIQAQSFIKDWERVTGYTWHRGNYHWLLYRAGQKGPSYNNLNDSTNTVWYNQDIDYQLAMFSHEFGIFLPSRVWLAGTTARLLAVRLPITMPSARLTCRRSVGYSTVCRKRASAIQQYSIARELWSI